MMYCQLEPLKSMYMVTGPQRTQIFVFQKKSDILWCSLGSSDHIHWFQWLQLAIHHGYVTLDESHMHWNKQKDLKVMLEPIRLCTILPGPNCIGKPYQANSRFVSINEAYLCLGKNHDKSTQLKRNSY